MQLGQAMYLRVRTSMPCLMPTQGQSAKSNNAFHPSSFEKDFKDGHHPSRLDS